MESKRWPLLFCSSVIPCAFMWEWFKPLGCVCWNESISIKNKSRVRNNLLLFIDVDLGVVELGLEGPLQYPQPPYVRQPPYDWIVSWLLTWAKSLLLAKGTHHQIQRKNALKIECSDGREPRHDTRKCEEGQRGEATQAWLWCLWGMYLQGTLASSIQSSR